MSESKNIILAKNTLILYAKLIVNSIVGLLSTRLLLKYLGVTDFGLYNVVASIVVMMNFLNVVMISTTYRYIAFELGKNDNIKGVNAIFNISFIIHLILALIVWLIGETLGIYYINNYLKIDSNNFIAIFVFRMSILATVINVISIPFQGLVVAYERFSVQSIIEIVKNILNLCFIIYLSYYVGSRVEIYSILMVILTSITTLLYVIYCKKYYFLQVKWNLQKKYNQYKELLSYSGWMSFGAAASIGKNSGIPILLNFFYGTILNASFGVANQLNRFLILFSQSLSQAAIPQITKSFSGSDNKRILTLVSYVSKYSFLLMYLLAFPILLELEVLLYFWIGELPIYTVIFCKLMIISALVDSLKAGIPAAIQATGKIKWFLLSSSSIQLLGLPICYFFLKNGFKPYIVFSVFIIISIITLFISMYLLKKIINFNVKELVKTSYLKIIFITIITLPIYYIGNYIENINLSLFFSLICVPILYVSIIFLVGLDKKEKKLLSSVIQTIKKKIN